MAVAKLHAETAFDHLEHLVLVVVMVKYELAVELDELDELPVEFGGDARFVELADPGEFLGDVYFGHGSLESGWEMRS
jgi:hypothetical protein